jgi:hypothetical protein
MSVLNPAWGIFGGIPDEEEEECEDGCSANG